VSAFDLKIEHGVVLTLDGQRRIVEDGAVAIRGDRIAAVDSTAALAGQPAARVIDATGRLVLPGLVSTHCHNLQAVARGLGNEVAFDVWTHPRIYPYETLLTDEDAYWSTLLSCAEMLRTGVTCHADPGGYAMDGVGQALTDCGMRGVFSWAGMDEFPEGHEPPAGFPGRRTTEETLAANEGLVKRWQKPARDRVRVAYGLRLEPNVSDELFQGVKACADRDQTLVQFHCLLPGVADAVKERVGMSTVQWMAALGALGPNWLLAHMAEASDSDVVIVKMHDARVAHEPTPGAASRKGKIAELLARGVTVGLGCDSTAASDSLDMFRAMRQVALVLEDRPEKALEMATIDGARALGWDGEIGSLEPGKRADVIVVDARRLASLISEGEGTDVETTIVDGRVLMDNRRLLTIDGARVLAESQRIAERIARQLPYHEPLRPRWPVL
jgi:5-methylthioadenosine/S-adenosylhomocysteine deaminase